MMIQPLYFLPMCLQFLWIQLPLSFTARFIDKSFVSYRLTWHIPLNKTHHVPSLSLECSNSRPPLAKRRQQRQKTIQASSSIAIALRCLDFFLTNFSLMRMINSLTLMTSQCHHMIWMMMTKTKMNMFVLLFIQL